MNIRINNLHEWKIFDFLFSRCNSYITQISLLRRGRSPNDIEMKQSTSELIREPNLVFSTVHFEAEPYLYHIANGNDDINIKTIQKQSVKMFNMF